MSPTSITAGADEVDATVINVQAKISLDGTALAGPVLDSILSWEVETALGRPDSCEIRLLLPMDSQATAEPAPAAWKPGTALKVEFQKEVLFDGEITSVDFEGGEGRQSEFVLLAYDKRHRLYRTETRKVMKDVTVSDIISQLLGGSGLSAGTHNGLPTTAFKHHLHVGTAGDYLDRVCATFGLTTVMDNGKVTVKSPKSLTTPAGAVSPNAQLLDYRFRRTSSGDTDKMKVSGWDPKQKQAIVSEVTRASVLPASSLAQPASGKTAFSSETTMVQSTFVLSEADAKSEAEGALRQSVDAGMQFEGTCLMTPKAKAGTVIEVQAVPAPYAGKYLLTSVTHTYDHADGARTHLRSRGADDVSVTGVLTSAVVDSSPAAPLDEKFHGVYPAIVTNIKSEASKGAVGEGGAAGEVMVKMPWLDDTLESSWMRVVTVGGGKDRGFFVMPEVNDEVLVAFEFGDPRRGYVLGGLYNGKDTAPIPAAQLGVNDAKIDQRIWKSRVGHQVLLSDKAGEEHILIAGKDPKHFIKIDVANKLISIEGEDYKLKTTGKVDVEATKAVTVKTPDDVTIEGKNVTIKASANLNLEATANATLKGTAGAKVEGAKVDVNSQGPATVKGNPIMLN